MKLLKKINNNYALALDSNGERIIVEGKGIGFVKMPCELKDLALISRTYYDTKEQDISLLQSVSEEVLEVSRKVFEYANLQIAEKLNPNLTLILADHIEFCIERYEKKMDLKMPISYDIELLYPRESKIAEFAVGLIREELKVNIPDSEKTGIALNIINSEIQTEERTKENDDLIQTCTNVIEREMRIKIRKDSFSYSRFVTHLEYLIRRARESACVSSENLKLYISVRTDFPEISRCADEIQKVFESCGLHLNEEEKLYLMLHINRLCSREDCYQ